MQVDGGTPQQVVKPLDWQELSSADLAARVSQHSWSSRSQTTEVFDLRDGFGVLIARLGYGRVSGDAAAVTYEGIRNGSIPHLVGIVLGRNNSDLVRLRAVPVPSESDWDRWAREVIARRGCDSLGIDALRDLHPLCPEMDLPVYEIGDRPCTEAELLSWVREQSSIIVYGDGLEYEDDDEVPKLQFDYDLKSEPDVVFLPPKGVRDLADSLGLPRVQYWNRLRRALRIAWGKVREVDDDELRCVARVNGIEILRDVAMFEQNAESV